MDETAGRQPSRSRKRASPQLRPRYLFNITLLEGGVEEGGGSLRGRIFVRGISHPVIHSPSRTPPVFVACGSRPSRFVRFHCYAPLFPLSPHSPPARVLPLARLGFSSRLAPHDSTFFRAGRRKVGGQGGGGREGTRGAPRRLVASSANSN